MATVWRLVIFSSFGALFVLHLQKQIKVRRNTMDINYILKPSEKIRKLQLNRMKERFKNITKQIYTYDKPNRIPGDIKFILKWTKSFQLVPDIHREGQTSFIESNCKHINCYMTHDRYLLVDYRYFDAIIFEAEQNWDIPPYFRSAHQKYIFAASTTDSHRLYCHPFYDNFYNLTWTYKLDSNIRWSFFTIEARNGTIVGPKANIDWIEPMLPTPRNVVNRLRNKKKAAAWFASTCKARSKREKVVAEILNEMEKYELKLDTYGWCGTLNCPKDRMDECLNLLEQEYYFYFAFENDLVVDYVTEQLLHAVQHMTVPVVFGGADYSRFLPPGSYIDARKLNASIVALQMYRAINNQEEYRNYFRWHNHYVYKTTRNKDVCKLCEFLNDPKKSHTVVPNFRSWWHDNDDDICKEQKELYKKHQHLNLLHQL